MTCYVYWALANDCHDGGTRPLGVGLANGFILTSTVTDIEVETSSLTVGCSRHALRSEGVRGPKIGALVLHRRNTASGHLSSRRSFPHIRPAAASRSQDHT
jgi:hypothetical protein